MSATLHNRALPQMIQRVLATPPQHGVHEWIFECARLLKPWRPDDVAVRVIAEAAQHSRRRVPIREIQDAVRTAKNDWTPKSTDSTNEPEGAPPPPPQPPPPRLVRDFDRDALASFASQCRSEPTPDLLREISWVPLPPEENQQQTTRLFLETVFEPGDKVLLFTDHRSQGDFGYVVGDGCWRLGDRPGDRPTRAELPTGGPCGVWFLNVPVTGKWEQNDYDRLSRRSWQCATRWPFLVLESDEAPTDQWIKALIHLPLPIAAIYTSGGRSVHALVRINACNKAEADAAALVLKDRLAPLGADPAALTSVRLSRLPGGVRCGATDEAGVYAAYETPRLQRLLWLTDAPADHSIAQDLHPF